MDLSDIDFSKIDSEQIEKYDIDKLNKEEQEVIKQIVEELDRKGHSRTLQKLYQADYEEIPVDIDTFLEDEQYLGEVLNGGDDIWPFWREQLRDIFEGEQQYTEVILTGAIGIGKTTIAVIGLCYILYRLMCLKDPQTYYGLAGGSEIAIAFFNVTKEQSEGVAYSQMQEYLLNSNWFRKRGNIRGTKDKWFVPDKNIEFIVGSQEEHGLGKDIFCVTGDHKVVTGNGFERVEDLVGVDNLLTLTYDKDSGDFEYSPSDGVVPRGVSDDIYEIEIEGEYTIEVTGDHLVLVEDGLGYHYYKEARNLDIGDELVSPEIERDLNLQVNS